MLDYSNLSRVLPIKPLSDYSSVTNKKTENTTPEKKKQLIFDLFGGSDDSVCPRLENWYSLTWQ